MKHILFLPLIFGLAVSGICLLGPVTADDGPREKRKDRENERERPKEREAGRGASIEGIMKTIHGKKGLMKSLETMLAAKNVNWDTVQATTKRIAPLAADLGKRKPDKGPKDSWAELAAVYADNAKELNDVALKKDVEAVKDAFKEFNSSCNKCHNLHRGR